MNPEDKLANLIRQKLSDIEGNTDRFKLTSIQKTAHAEALKEQLAIYGSHDDPEFNHGDLVTVKKGLQAHYVFPHGFPLIVDRDFYFYEYTGSYGKQSTSNSSGEMAFAEECNIRVGSFSEKGDFIFYIMDRRCLELWKDEE